MISLSIFGLSFFVNNLMAQQQQKPASSTYPRKCPSEVMFRTKKECKKCHPDTNVTCYRAIDGIDSGYWYPMFEVGSTLKEIPYYERGGYPTKGLLLAAYGRYMDEFAVQDPVTGRWFIAFPLSAEEWLRNRQTKVKEELSTQGR